VARQRPVGPLPEVDELEDLLGLFALAKIGVGVAERASVDILGEKREHALLSATAHRDEVALHARVLSVVGDRVEVEIERVSVEELLAGDPLVVARQELGDLLVADARRVLGQESCAWG